MSTELAPVMDAEVVARVLLRGDLRQLTASQKVSYYRSVCESVGLNPLTQPFEYLVLNGREILYARREATEQLRRIHTVSITIQSRELVGETYIVSARAAMPSGRTDESIGVKSIDGLKGDVRANAMMTAETKAKRRVTLSICGLGMLDETEVADIPPAAKGAPPAQLEAVISHAEPDEPPAPEGFVRVQLIESTPTKNPTVIRFSITLSSGEVVTTINNWLASLAQDALEKRTPVKVETKVSKWGTDLVSLKAAADPDRQPAPEPLTADDIPF
jgi:hypothetical protein